jgi:hypothetical protein
LTRILHERALAGIAPSHVREQVQRAMRFTLRHLLLATALFIAVGPAVGEQTDAHRQRRDHNLKHGQLLRELKETNSPSRKKVLEEELVVARRRKSELKYVVKGHPEDIASRIVDLEDRLHGLQDKRTAPVLTSDDDKADHRAELKALRSELSRLKFPNDEERQALNGRRPEAVVKNVKDLRAQAKALRAQIRTETDAAEKQTLREQLDALYQ